MPIPPRVAAIHDLSGFGRCSLTVALPVLSALGAEVCALPTAVLSSHTGGLPGYTYRDLTDDMPAAIDQWAALGLSFQAIYSGFLGSKAQLAIVADFITRFRAADTLVLVDPVLGDNGKPYTPQMQDIASGMAALCAKADIITPNLTEAALLLNIPYRQTITAREDMAALCRALCGLGPTRTVVTGLALSHEESGAAAYDARTDTLTLHAMPRVPGIWHGTGDLFGSVLLGSLLRGMTLSAATSMAVDFSYDCIASTYSQETDPRFGVLFEPLLPKLIEKAHKPACFDKMLKER